MPNRCSVLNCLNTSKNGHFLYSFPRDENIRLIWEIRIRGPEWKATKYSFICEAHFEEWCFESHESANVKGKRKLKEGAVPSIDCPYILDCPAEISEASLKRKAESDRAPKKHIDTSHLEEVKVLEQKIKMLILEKNDLLKKLQKETKNKSTQIGVETKDTATRMYNSTREKATQSRPTILQSKGTQTCILTKTTGTQSGCEANEKGAHSQTTKKDTTPSWTVLFRKYKKRGPTARKKLVACTYGYLREIAKKIATRCQSPLKDKKTNLCTTTSSNYNHPDKQQVIQDHQTILFFMKDL